MSGQEYYQNNKEKWKQYKKNLLEKSPNYWKESYAKNKQKHRERKQKRLRFKGIQIFLKEKVPRTRVCSYCGKGGKTDMHHLKYDESDPLAHTIELCPSCHQTQHQHKRDTKGRFKS